MDQLWAPWRLSYVAGAKAPADSEASCFLCRGLAEDDDRRNLIVLRTPRSAALLNRYPYNNGHVLIVPQVHLARLDQLSDDDHADLAKTMQKVVSALERLIKADGFNIGLNLGQAAGAGVPGHLHWHVVPRWSGDTNFMPVVAATKVIAQSLDAMYEQLATDLARPPASPKANAP
jgi:ATP adenylyltransferase